MSKNWKLKRDSSDGRPSPSLTARDVVVSPADTPSAIDIAAMRLGMGLSQSVFAQALNVSTETVRGWEQGKRTPDGASLRLLELAARHPQWVFAMLKEPGVAHSSIKGPRK